MKIYAPNYYPDFTCIADRCEHNCCIGWEIDIDKNTLDMYKSLEGELGSEINKSIEETGSTNHFVLDKNMRCPHLNNSNLCNIILSLGKSYLCSICKDHPRFRNFFSCKEEIGLGLCCEEAAKIILSFPDKFSFIDLTPEEHTTECSLDEKLFFDFREKILETICDRNTDINTRIQKILESNNVHMPNISIQRWFGLLSTLEYMDKNWIQLLKKAKNNEYDSTSVLSPLQTEQLFVYFILRHLPSGIEDGNYKPQIAFAYLSVLIINELCSYMKYTDLKDIIEICRMYSSEIEYSDENLDLIFELLNKPNN